MGLKRMEDLLAFSAREVKRAAAEETSIPLQKDSESPSHPSELSED